MIKQYNITDYIKDDPELQKAVIKEFLNDIKRLQTENERLKEEIKTYDKAQYEEFKRAEEYKQALEEIREHVKGCCHKFSSNHKDLCFGCEYDKDVCDYSIILDKISEVLKGEEC